MHTLARNINLPASFVEIRHAATHESLPTLSVLRTVAQRALDWLWSNYWATLDSPPSLNAGQSDMYLSRARMLLKQWRHLRRDNPLKELKHGDRSADGKAALGIIKECVGMCKESEGLDTLIDALLEEKALIPAGKKKGALMNGAIMLWMPLLDSLDAYVAGFASALLRGIMEVLKGGAQESPIAGLLGESVLAEAREEQGGVIDGEFAEAVGRWLMHLTSVDAKVRFGKGTGGAVDIEELARACVLSPCEWYPYTFVFYI
jgi:ribosomal biogenesis protein LAS1